MIFGGIPYYLGYIESSQSLAQNVDRLFFYRNGVLKNEFDRLFDSVFTNPDIIKSIVKVLYARNAGYTRKEITEKLGISDGGTLTKHLNELLASDFVIKYVPFGFSKREEHYKLADPFCLFYLHFVRDVPTDDFVGRGFARLLSLAGSTHTLCPLLRGSLL